MLDALIALIGLDATETLLHLYGGSEVYIPVSDECRLADQIGATAFGLLREQYGGDRLWIPQGKSMFLQVRNQLIVKESASSTVKELSAKFRVCPRRIHQILSEAR